MHLLKEDLRVPGAHPKDNEQQQASVPRVLVSVPNQHRHFAPRVLQRAMAETHDAGDKDLSKQKSPYETAREGPEIQDDIYKRISSDAIQRLIDKECQRHQLTAGDRGEYVMTTPEGYIIYRTKHQKTYGVAGVPDIFRIVRPEPSESMRAMQSGCGLCMCRAMGTCPFMAYRHPPPCPLCTDPLIIRYYPSDNHWWSLHDKAKELRRVVDLEN